MEVLPVYVSGSCLMGDLLTVLVKLTHTVDNIWPYVAVTMSWALRCVTRASLLGYLTQIWINMNVNWLRWLWLSGVIESAGFVYKCALAVLLCNELHIRTLSSYCVVLIFACQFFCIWQLSVNFVIQCINGCRIYPVLSDVLQCVEVWTTAKLY